MITSALFLAVVIEFAAVSAPGVEAVFQCRTSAQALIPLPERILSLTVQGNAFRLEGSDEPPLARARIATRSPGRLELLADVKGFDAEFQAELEHDEDAWRISWRVIEATGRRGELTLEVEGAGFCTMSGAVG